MHSSRLRGLERLAALKQGAAVSAAENEFHRGRFEMLKQDDSKPRSVSAFNLFQTPVERARELIAGIDFAGLRVLEPSAGLGRLYRAIREQDEQCEIVLVDSSPDCTNELARATEGDSTSSVLTDDFLQLDPDDFEPFDVVVMNPPFKRGLDCKHINHALGFLKQGGLLRALCYNGATQNKKLRPNVDRWQVLPDGSFKSEGTRASIVQIEIRK